MIYALTKNELATLFTVADRPAGHSPARDAVKNVRPHRKDGEAALQKLGLIYMLPEIPPAPTVEGSLLAKALFTPEAVVSFGRRDALPQTTHALRLGDLWYVLDMLPQQKIFLIYAYLSTQKLAEWINERVFRNYTPPRAGAPFAIDLTYEEWLLFLASQVLFVKREAASTKSAGELFDRGALVNPEISRFFKTGLGSLGLNDLLQTANRLFSDNRRTLDKTVGSLIRKGVFETRKDPHGAEALTYTEDAIRYLDNDLLQDTAVFAIRRGTAQTSLMLALRKTGVVAVYDNGGGVHVERVSAVPWAEYLK